MDLIEEIEKSCIFVSELLLLHVYFAWVFVCIKLTSKRLKRSGPKFCGTLRDPREGMIEFSKISL